MSITDYIIARQLGMAPSKVANRPTVKRRQACAVCGRQLAYDANGAYVHISTNRTECYR